MFSTLKKKKRRGTVHRPLCRGNPLIHSKSSPLSQWLCLSLSGWIGIWELGDALASSNLAALAAGQVGIRCPPVRTSRVLHDTWHAHQGQATLRQGKFYTVSDKMPSV